MIFDDYHITFSFNEPGYLTSNQIYYLCESTNDKDVYQTYNASCY